MGKVIFRPMQFYRPGSKSRMSRKSLLIWVLLLLIVAVMKTSASGPSDEINNLEQEGTNIDDVAHDNGDQGSGEDEDEDEEEEEQHAQPQDYSLTDFLSQNDSAVDPDTILAQIIGGGVTRISLGVIASLPPDYIFSLLENPVGARIAASHLSEIFSPTNSDALVVELINEEFFLNLDLFSNRAPLTDLQRVPSNFVIKTIQVHSREKKFDLNGFIDKFESYDQSLSFEIPKTLCLPHLFNLPRLHNPEYFMGRGISYDTDLPNKDKLIWDISLQLFLYRLLNDESFKNSEKVNEMLATVKQEIASCRRHLGQDIDFNMNYFGLQNSENLNIFEDFMTIKLFTIEERSISLDEISSILGLPNFTSIDYISLNVEERIVYRLIIFLIIFNPTLVPETSTRNDLIINFLNVVPAKDFTEAELDFLTCACINQKLGDVIATVFRDLISPQFRGSIEKKITASTEAFNFVLKSITNEMDKLHFLKRGNTYFTTSLRINNEEFYTRKQSNRPTNQANNVIDLTNSSAMVIVDAVENEEEEPVTMPLVRTKRYRNGDQVPESHFASHFLTSDQIQSFGPLQTHGHSTQRTSFTLPYPNKDHFVARFDNMMQNLQADDLGEIAWKERVNRLDANEKKAYEDHENILDEFVRLTFQVVDYMRLHPDADVHIRFRGSPSHGGGLKFEALETFARAILLPRFKVFWYNPDIYGFIPYPLLHQEIMSCLGYLNRWFISNGLPLSWNLSEEYLKFLFYEEDPFESMQNVVERFYGVIFRNLDGLKAPGISPLDYFTTTFYPHQPLAFNGNALTIISPLDLFTPSETSRYTSLFDYLDRKDIDFLAEYILPPDNGESKVENEDFFESKEDFCGDLMDLERQSTLIDEESPFYKQLSMKVEIIEALKHAASQEIIQMLLLGRFAFIRNFLPCFNSLAQDHITASLYSCLQKAQAKEITANILMSGLSFTDERIDIKILDNEGQVYTPRQALYFILDKLPKEMMKTFYWFCTGCWTLPLGNLSSNPIGVVINQVERLPSARTCFRSFNFNLNPKLNLNGHLEAMRRVLKESTGFNADEGIDVRDQIVGVFVDVPVNPDERMENGGAVVDERGTETGETETGNAQGTDTIGTDDANAFELVGNTETVPVDPLRLASSSDATTSFGIVEPFRGFPDLVDLSTSSSDDEQ